MNCQILNGILLLISTKPEILPLNQDLEFKPKQQWYSYYVVQLANSYRFQNAAEWF